MLTPPSSSDADKPLNLPQALGKSTFDWETALANLPTKPGIYYMYNGDSQLLYVGKAKNLRNRVRSYFQKSAQHTLKVRTMVGLVAYFETLVTDTEVEALILEANVVKTKQPPYNILLKDDKRFPWLVLTDETYPRLLVTRRPQRLGSKSKAFGPYTNSNELYSLLKALRKHFPLRQRRLPLFKDRPCMNFHVKLCPGPCQSLVSVEAYHATVRQVELFLKGQSRQLEQQLSEAMQQASDELAFEKAAELRDRLQIVEQLSHRHKVVSDDVRLNQDVIGVADDGWLAVVMVLMVREGKLLGNRSFDIGIKHGETLNEVLEGFLLPYYKQVPDEALPKEILLPLPLEEPDLLEAWLSERRQASAKPKAKTTAATAFKVNFVWPQRGHGKELLALAQQNAMQRLEQARHDTLVKEARDPLKALLELQEVLDLPHAPHRMECYDISHFQGSQTVASMVVFTDGEPDTAAYRRFKIKSAEGKPDDFESMREVIRRRLEHRDDWGEPDLLIIDGGKGQLSSALESLHAAAWHDQPIISLAKRYEEVFLPGRSEPILLPKTSLALQLLQQIRDEAHRFAITFHRQLRDKKSFSGPLDGVQGIGPKRKAVLLKHFRTWEALQQASVPQLALALSCSQGQALKVYDAIQAVHSP
jgi:excinuclease ABC subunit C